MNLPSLYVAMITVQADLDRDHPDAPQLHVHLAEGCAYVADDAERHVTSGGPLIATDDGGALVAVAQGVQDFLAELDRVVWPICPTHAHGVHVRPAPGEHHGETPYGQPWIGPVAWWCRGDAGHMLAEVGRLGLT